MDESGQNKILVSRREFVGAAAGALLATPTIVKNLETAYKFLTENRVGVKPNLEKQTQAELSKIMQTLISSVNNKKEKVLALHNKILESFNDDNTKKTLSNISSAILEKVEPLIDLAQKYLDENSISMADIEIVKDVEKTLDACSNILQKISKDNKN